MALFDEENQRQQYIAERIQQEEELQTQKGESKNYVPAIIVIAVVVTIVLAVYFNFISLFVGTSIILFLSSAYLALLYFLAKKQEKLSLKYVPIDPEKEFPEFEEKLHKIGLADAKIREMVSVPKYGPGSELPLSSFLRGDYFDRKNKIRKTFCIGINIPNRSFSNIEINHYHIENDVFDRISGAKKYPFEPTPSRIIIPSPRIEVVKGLDIEEEE